MKKLVLLIVCLATAVTLFTSCASYRKYHCTCDAKASLKKP